MKCKEVSSDSNGIARSSTGRNFIVSFVLFLSFNFSALTAISHAQWAQYSLPYYGIAYTLGFYDLNRGLSFGHTFFPFNEKLFYTTNAGNNWLLSAYPPEIRAVSDVQYISSSVVYACGAENVIMYNKPFSYNQFLSFPKNIRDKYIREGKTEFYSEYKSAFIKSTNGGLNWQKGSLFDTLTGYINDIHFFDANTGYALIDSNSIGNTRFYKTTNAGTNWQLIRKIDSAEVDRMVFFDANTGFAKGFSWGGRIYKTTNAGVNWSVNTMPTQIDDFTFFNSSTGIAVGISESLSATVYRTTNGGNNWSIVNTLPDRQFHTLKILSGTGTAFAVGNVIDTLTLLNTKITTIKTTDYGLTWVPKVFNPSVFAYGISLVDANNFYMSGGDLNLPALILKSTNGGNVFINQISTEVPSKYSLSQNYPNPFNPTTKIKFSIPSSVSSPHGLGGLVRRGGDLVLLKVYDIMGREVRTLVNERLQPGTYEASFDSSMLNSGVYFYKMVVRNAGSLTDWYSESKNMLLIK